MRNDLILKVLGPDYWDIASHAARAAFPDSLLVYNDFGMGQDMRDMLARRQALLARLDALQKRGTPIDAVDLKSRLTLARPFDPRPYRAFLGEIAGRGLKIVVSEPDVSDFGSVATREGRNRAAAAMRRRYLDAALAEPAVSAVVTWGLSDRQSWITAGHQRRFRRAARLRQHPLPSDVDFKPKSAFDAILEAFRAAPFRQLR